MHLKFKTRGGTVLAVIGWKSTITLPVKSWKSFGLSKYFWYSKVLIRTFNSCWWVTRPNLGEEWRKRQNKSATDFKKQIEVELKRERAVLRTLEEEHF